MHTAPVPCMPIAWAALRVRSSVTPLVYGPRSLTVTITDFPVRGREAAVRLEWLAARRALALPVERRDDALAARAAVIAACVALEGLRRHREGRDGARHVRVRRRVGR